MEKPVYDDSDTDLDEIEKAFRAPDATTSGSQKLAEQKEFEDKLHAPSATDSGSQKLEDAKNLKDKEEGPPDRSGFSAADDINEKLGRGYTGKGSRKSKRLTKFASSNSALKKRIAFAGASAGGSVLVAVAVFFLMLPLKIENALKGLEGDFGAAVQSAEQKELQSLYSKFVSEKILPNLTAGRCTSTVDTKCVSVSPGASPINKLFTAWRDGNLEQRMAKPTDSSPSVLIGMKAGKLYLNVNGIPYADTATMDHQLREVQLRHLSLFDISGTTRATTNQVRRAAFQSLEGVTRFKAVFLRFKINAYLLRKYGIQACWMFCNRDRVSDRLVDSLAEGKLAAKLAVTQIITPFSQSYSLLVQCMINPGQCDYKLNPTTEGIQQSDINSRLDRQLNSYLAEHGSERLAAIAEKAGKINEAGGLQNYAIKATVQAIAKQIGGEGAEVIAGKVVVGAIPIAGAVGALLAIIQGQENIPKVDKAVAYKARALADLQMNSLYTTQVQEMHSGRSNLAALGSFSDMLGDYTRAPLYHSIQPTLNSPVNADIFAATTAVTSDDSNTCNDGTFIPAGKLACPEEDLSDPGVWVRALNFFLDSSETTTSGGLHLPSYLPGAATYNSITAPVLGFAFTVKGFVGDVIGAIPGVASDATIGLCQKIPPCKGVLNNMLGGLSSFLVWGGSFFIPNLASHFTSTRVYNMIGAGEDVKQNEACQDLLGCRKLSSSEVATIRNEQSTQERQDFDSQPLFARMFSTNTPYSLVSQLATDMPSSMSSMATSGFASLLTSPLSKFSSVFSGIFPGSRTFAAQPTADPFGVDQYGITDLDLARMHGDDEGYWDQHCANGDEGVYNTETGELSVPDDWQTSHQSQSDSTMQPVSNDANLCMLINSVAQTAGVMFSASEIPAGAANSDDDSSSDSTTSAFVPASAAVQAKQTAKQTNGFVKTTTTTKKSNYFQQTIGITQKVACTNVCGHLRFTVGKLY